MATLIFDFDGTIADTFPLIVEITANRLGHRQPSSAKIEQLRRMPTLQALHEIGAAVWSAPYVVWRVRRLMYRRMAEVPVFPGIPATIKTLYENGHRLLILSSNLETTVRLFLAEHKLDGYFDKTYHCSTFRKGAALKKILRRNRISAPQCLYIGNEAADIEEAQAVGIKAVAVTWSGQDPALLSAALPARIIDAPRELVPLIEDVV